MKKETNEKLKKLIPALCVLPFVIGAIGYMLAGEKFSDSLYYSFSLYFVNLNSDAYNVIIEIARWTAALVTATAVLYVFKQIWINLRRAIKSLRKDSVAVYSDNDKKIVFEEKSHAVIYSGRVICPRAKNHIIMMESDTDGLKFYNDNKAKFGSRKVYIGIREMEYGSIKDISDVTFYDIDGVIARTLWKSIRLWDGRNAAEKLTITILGNGHLGQNILNYGLLLNLFSLEQCITYNFVGDGKLYQVAHGKIETCNKDSVAYYTSDDEDIWNVIRRSDVIIIADKVSAEQLQTIGTICENGRIFYYAPDEGDVGSYIKFDNLFPYGKDCEIYTDENIRRGKLVKQAMALNYKYALKYGGSNLKTDSESEWNKLDGFLKWSNISSADYHEVLRAIVASDSEVSIEELAELEHMRWCRFHYLNNWKYGVPDNGKNKDNKKKIHKCLRAYDLIGDEQDKDREVVREALGGE